jgi:hypothetical protein
VKGAVYIPEGADARGSYLGRRRYRNPLLAGRARGDSLASRGPDGPRGGSAPVVGSAGLPLARGVRSAVPSFAAVNREMCMRKPRR